MNAPLKNLSDRIREVSKKSVNEVYIAGAGGGKGGGGSSHVPTEDPNTLKSNAVARLIDVIGHGPIVGLVNGAKSIYLSDTPYMNAQGGYNFKGIGYTFQNGYVDQGALTGISASSSEKPVGVQLKQETGPIIRQITNDDVDRVRIRFMIPNLSYQNPNTGDLKGNSVAVGLRYRRSNSATWINYRSEIEWKEFPSTTTLFGYVSTGSPTSGVGTRNWTTVTPEAATALRVSGIAAETFNTFLIDLGPMFGPTPTYPAAPRIQYRVKGTTTWYNMPVKTTSQGQRQQAGYGNGSRAGTLKQTIIMETRVEAEISLIGAAVYEIQVVGGSIAAASYGNDVNLTINGKCVAPYEFTATINKPAGTGPWEWEATRISPDDVNVNKQSQTWVQSYTEIIDAKFSWPGVAHIGLVADASQFGNSIPPRAYHVKGRIIRVFSNYNPETRAYSGFWDGTWKDAYTNNPVLVYIDLVLNRWYGLGDYITEADLPLGELYTLAQYCDELVPDGYGGMEPRFTINVVLNTQREAHAVLQDMASVFRGMTYYSEGQIRVAHEAPRDVDINVGRANAVDGVFHYEGISDKTRHNVVNVTYNDLNDMFKGNSVTVEDNDDILVRGQVSIDLAPFGCSSRGMAARVGEFYLFTEKNEGDIISYNAASDHAAVEPGFIAAIFDPVIMGTELFGRIEAVDGTKITLDREIEIKYGESYILSTLNKSGKPQYKTVISPLGVHKTIEIMSEFTDQPGEWGVWSLYSNNVSPVTYRIRSVDDNGDGTFKIEGNRYVEQKFDYIEKGIDFDLPTITSYSSGELATPADFSIAETLYKENGLVKTRATFSWSSSTDPRVRGFRFYWKAKDGPWNDLTTTETTIDIAGLEAGFYSFRLVAISGNRQSPPKEKIDYYLYGKTLPPGDVLNVQVKRMVEGVIFTWDSAVDIGSVSYQIRELVEGSTWSTSDIIAENLAVTNCFISIPDAKEHTYLIRAFDELGNMSVNATAVSASVIAPEAPTNFFGVAQTDSIRLSWDQSEGLGVEYPIREGLTWDLGQPIMQTASDTLTVLNPGSGVRTFWIKAVSPQGLYSEDAVFVTVGLELFYDRNVVLEYDNANDGGEGAYPGVNVMMEQGIEGTLLLSEIAPGQYAQAGEHVFFVDLGIKYRARCWVDTSLINVTGEGPSWDDWSYAWEDVESDVPWLPTGNTDGVSLEKFISANIGPQSAGELFGWTMNDTTDDFRGVEPTVEDNVAYAPAKYADGLYVSDVTTVEYDVSVPEIFTFPFKLHTDHVYATSVVFWVLKNTSSGEWLRAGYDKATDCFYVDDSDGNYTCAPSAMHQSGEDFITIAVKQGTNTRSLYVYFERTYTERVVEADIDAPGTFNHLCLYDAT